MQTYCISENPNAYAPLIYFIYSPFIQNEKDTPYKRLSYCGFSCLYY